MCTCLRALAAGKMWVMGELPHIMEPSLKAFLPPPTTASRVLSIRRWPTRQTQIGTICMVSHRTQQRDNCGPERLLTGLPSNTHYRQKNMELFLFQWLFAFLWGVHGVSVLEIHSYEQILLWGKLISTWQQNEAQMFKNNYFGIFLNQTMVEILVVPVSVYCYIHAWVELRYCAQYHGLFTYFGAASRGLASWGPRIEGHEE